MMKNAKHDPITGVTMSDCDVCGERYELILGSRAAATPDLKSGVVCDPRPPHLDNENYSLTSFCSTECREKLTADILAVN